MAHFGENDTEPGGFLPIIEQGTGFSLSGRGKHGVHDRAMDVDSANERRRCGAEEEEATHMGLGLSSER
jgi:hypothetical protein